LNCVNSDYFYTFIFRFQEGGIVTPIKWGPANFGPAIKTAYDEFRPIIIPTQPDLFLNDMLIFSSNRPGGKGGFDLYYTGMDKRGE